MSGIATITIIFVQFRYRVWGHPDDMSASEGEGGHGKADVVREVA